MAVDIGIDLGTASILVYVKGKGVILKEPSVVAFDRDSNEVKAIGEEARLMLGRTPGNIIAVRPLRQGVISDYTVTEKMIKAYRNRMINIHPSLIPSFCGTGYYGLHVHEAALKRGVKISGATVHFVDEGTDTGPIIMQKPVEVRPDDTPEVLQRRIMEQAEWQIMPKVIDLIAHDKVHVKDGRVFVEE